MELKSNNEQEENPQNDQETLKTLIEELDHMF